MAGWTGLEPAAFRVTGGRYNQLNYHPAAGVVTLTEGRTIAKLIGRAQSKKRSMRSFSTCPTCLWFLPLPDFGQAKRTYNSLEA